VGSGASTTLRRRAGASEALHALAALQTASDRREDEFGGWTLPIFQSSFGHRAEKATLLYIVGCEPADIPEMPLVLGDATHVIASSGRRTDGGGSKGRSRLEAGMQQGGARAYAGRTGALARRIGQAV
jgi:hypothetical protein